MKKTSINLPRRYPGLKPFERSQQAVFHGRQEDVQRLSNLILRERLVVLFAKSGIGKTSLLQAGVAPELERQDFVPIMLRTERSDKPILESVVFILENTPQLSGRNSTGARPGKTATLWEQMKRLEFDVDGLPATPVLVFDQFEEAFTLSHRDSSRNKFLDELADVVNGTMPEGLRKELLTSFQSGEIDIKTMQWWEEQPDLRIVLSIRSDFLHMVDGMSSSIPGILKNRYQLLPLNREKARTAIVMPAAASGSFSSPAFHYSEEALSEMIDFLAGDLIESNTDSDVQVVKKKDEIEAVNLQIICMDVEERVIDYQKEKNFNVTPEFYDGQNGLGSSIRNFYANQLNAFPKAYVERLHLQLKQDVALKALDETLMKLEPLALHDLARQLIEENLITPGNRRNSVVDDTLIDEYGVTNDFLDTLVDKSRLLRKEPRLDDFYYEISHDTLLPAIIESRNSRRFKEKADLEKAAYEAKLAEEAKRREAIEQELKTTRRQRRLARTVALTSSVSLFVSVLFGIWFVRDYVQSARAQLKSAEGNVYIEQYDAAISGYNEILGHQRRLWILEESNPPKDVKREKEITKMLMVVWDHSVDSLYHADSLMFADNYDAALTCYRNAIKFVNEYKALVKEHPIALPNNVTAPRVDPYLIIARQNLLEKRQANALKTLIREFKISQKDYEVFNEAQVWGQAFARLQVMQDLLPDHPDDQLALQKELQLNTPIDQYLATKIKVCKNRIR